MEIRNVVIVGAGLMGKGIAQVFASCEDFRVTLYDVKDDGVLDAVCADMLLFEKHGILTADEVERRMKRISFTTNFDDPCFAEADLVLESVFENMQLKQDLFEQLEQRCRKDAIFATNTSVMSPTEMSVKIKHKERLVVAHFWNPPHLIPIVEVCKSDYTTEEVAQTMYELLERSGKMPVYCKKEVPGFIGNRLQHALWREAIALLENDIADAATIDKTIRYTFGLRLPQLGPMENIDMVGTDLVYNTESYLFPHLYSPTKPSPILKKLTDEGALGFKTDGNGIQQWTPEQIEKSRRGLSEHLIKMLYKK